MITIAIISRSDHRLFSLDSCRGWSCGSVGVGDVSVDTNLGTLASVVSLLSWSGVCPIVVTIIPLVIGKASANAITIVVNCVGEHTGLRWNTILPKLVSLRVKLSALSYTSRNGKAA